MSIYSKNGANQWLKITQPYFKLSETNWIPAKKKFTKTLDGWKEVWPNYQVYIHYNYGYNLNMHTLFGSPNTPGYFIFINRGYIGAARNGGAANVALDTGVFPAGSELTFINEGYVSGGGGDGAWYLNKYAALSQPKCGSSGIRFSYPTTVDNSKGIIQGGGGGGGVTGEFSG